MSVHWVHHLKISSGGNVVLCNGVMHICPFNLVRLALAMWPKCSQRQLKIYINSNVRTLRISVVCLHQSNSVVTHNRNGRFCRIVVVTITERIYTLAYK